MAWRVLLIAPDLDLEHTEDNVAGIVNALNAHVVRRANIHTVLDAAETAYDCVWFAAHGGPSGIQLDDGYLACSEIANVVRSSGCRLVVLNTCDSLPIALEMQGEIHTDFVCTVGPIDDRTAYVAGRAFARALGRGNTPYEAYQKTRVGRTDYVFLAGNQTIMGNGNLDNARLIKLAEDVDKLITLMHGDKDWQIPSLLRTVEETKEKVDELERHLRYIQVMLPLLFGLTVIILFSVVFHLVLP